MIAELCQEFNVLAITDEIYEHIIYDGETHTPTDRMMPVAARRILVNSLSKTYSVTGWRVGWVLASPDLTSSIRKVHDFMTVGAAAPLQEAGAVAMALPATYYEKLAADYTERRNMALGMLERSGFKCSIPKGAYYIMTDITAFGFSNDVAMTRHLVENIGIAAVPGSSFFHQPEFGRQMIRFCFPKKYETLKEAEHRLSKM